MSATAKSGHFLQNLRAEAPVVAGAATTVIFFTVGKGWADDFSQPLVTAAIFVWLFAAMIWCAFGVVRHAEVLAEYLGEPVEWPSRKHDNLPV
jgi:Ca2+:H+ antiporter